MSELDYCLCSIILAMIAYIAFTLHSITFSIRELIAEIRLGFAKEVEPENNVKEIEPLVEPEKEAQPENEVKEAEPLVEPEVKEAEPLPVQQGGDVKDEVVSESNISEYEKLLDEELKNFEGVSKEERVKEILKKISKVPPYPASLNSMKSGYQTLQDCANRSNKYNLWIESLPTISEEMELLEYFTPLLVGKSGMAARAFMAGYGITLLDRDEEVPTYYVPKIATIVTDADNKIIAVSGWGGGSSNPKANTKQRHFQPVFENPTVVTRG